MAYIEKILQIVLFSYPVFVSIGLILNCLAFIIFSRKKFHNTVFWIYFRFLLISDSLSFFLPINSFLELAFEIRIKNFSNFLCKFRMYWVYSVYPISGWTLALVSIDRFLSISFPNRFLFRKKVFVQIIACILIMAFNFIYFAPATFYYLIEFKELNNITNETDVYKRCKNPGIPIDLMDLIGTTLIPFLIMILFTIITLISLFRMRKNTLQMNTIRSKDKRFAIVTITVNFLFFALNIPYGLYQNLTEYFEENEYTDLILYIFLLFLCLNSGTTFFINFIVNKMFRNELKIFINCIRNKLF